MVDLDEVALVGASTFLRLLILAANSVLDPGSYHGEVALHRISPFECLYDLTAWVVDVVHFLWYNSHDIHGGIIFLITQSYLPLRLALNIPSMLHGYKILRLEDSFWTKAFAVSYLLCWISAKIYPMRSQQLTVAETHRIRRKVTNPVFFGLSQCLACFAVFSDGLEAALWSWFGVLVIAGFSLAISPTPPQINPQRNSAFETILQVCFHLICLAILWLFEYSPTSLSLKVRDQNWRESRVLMVMAVLQFDAAVVFLVAARADRWSLVRFALVGASLVGMAYVHYIELYALMEGTRALLSQARSVD